MRRPGPSPRVRVSRWTTRRRIRTSCPDTCWNQLHSAAEHIDAVARLLSGEHGVLHIRADYTLVRASIESAAMAHWALMPRDRTERVTRLLQIMHKDALDGARVLENKEQQRAVLAPTLARIREVAGREGLDAAACLKQFDAVSVLRWVSKRAQTEALFNWRLCSGMAHGKQWATQALSDREVVEQSGNVVSQKMTGRSDHLLIPCVAVSDILAQLLPVFHGRRGAVEHAPPQLGLRTATRTTS